MEIACLTVVPSAIHSLVSCTYCKVCVTKCNKCLPIPPTQVGCVLSVLYSCVATADLTTTDSPKWSRAQKDGDTVYIYVTPPFLFLLGSRHNSGKIFSTSHIFGIDSYTVTTPENQGYHFD